MKTIFIKDYIKTKENVFNLRRELKSLGDWDCTKEKHQELIKELGKMALLQDCVEVCTIDLTREVLERIWTQLRLKYKDMLVFKATQPYKRDTDLIMTMLMLEVEGKIEYLEEVLNNA